MRTQTKILIAALGFLVIFIGLRYHHYSRQRREEHHDEYLMAMRTDDGKYKKCPDAFMMGFKYSVILAMLTVNLMLMLYLISIHK